MSMEDQENLVLLAKNGDKKAFGEIYKLYAKKIYRFIYYLVSDSELAHDLGQTAFLKCWKSLAVFDFDRGTLQAFLFAIARNLVIDHQRKKKDLVLNEDFAQKIESNENLEEKVIRDEERLMVREALNKLNGEQKEILILHYFEDLNYSEVSKIVNKKEGAVRVSVHRALKKLKEVLQKQNGK